MDIFQLECFMSVAKLKSFTEAAYDISISQSSLSKHISKLEDEVGGGVKLFDRGKRTVELTPPGEAFLPYAENILNEYYRMQKEMKSWTSGGQLHIGSIEHMGRVGLTAPIASFLTAEPQVQISISKGSTIDLMSLLCEHKIDLAFIAHILSPDGKVSNIDSYPLDEYQCYTLVEDEYHLVVRQNHPFASRESVRWEELASEKFVILDQSYSINAIIRNSFQLFGIQPHIVFESDQVDTLLGLVADGFGITFLSRKIAEVRYDIRTVRLESPIQRNTVMVIPKSQEKNRCIERFCQHILSCYQK